MALTANVGSNLQAKMGDIQAYTVGTGANIYRGALVAIRLTDGCAYQAVNDVNDEYKQLIVGYALEAKTSGEVRVRRDVKLRLNFNGVISPTVVGRLACLYDDETVQLYDPTKCRVVVGRISEITGNQVYVDLRERPNRIATGLYD